jgi:hypothetical protein
MAMMALTGGAERALCLPYIRVPNLLNRYTLTLKMAAILFVETLDNSQQLNRKPKI